MAAIHAPGSVGDCLNAVLWELGARTSFLEAIKSRLVADGIAQDNISSLGHRARSLENTLKVRLGMLNPEREASWFRISPSPTSGPFNRSLLTESVFFPYKTAEWSAVRDRVLTCWRTAKPYHDENSPARHCLWSMLLALNSQFSQLIQLPSPYEKLTLETLPDGLPDLMESRSLRAFLLNVRNEVYMVRRTLDSSFELLKAASEKLWASQAKATIREKSAPHREQPEEMREEFKRRRQQSRFDGDHRKAAERLESLKFMGFDTDPTPDALRRRYLMMAKSLHPDRPGGDEAAFKLLTIAYGRLGGKQSGNAHG